MSKQLELNIYDSDEIIKICDLEKEDTPLMSKVTIDEFTDEANKNFDFDFDGINKFYPFKLPLELNNLDFNILCIVGASGSGKTTFSNYFGKEEKLEYDYTKSIMSHFSTPEEAVDKLEAVGLCSIPTWCKPRNVLSVGEGFRVDLARRLKDNCVIDEFTSNVDRNVALSCASSISKYIRRKNLKKCVFVSCHKDFIDVLQPDYVIDLDEKAVYDTRRLARRNFELQVYSRQDKDKIWRIFSNHHYLSSDLNKACNLYVAFLNNEIVGMCAVLAQPNAYCLNGYRVHRLVVLPDYQGLGIGKKLLTWVCEYYNKHNKVMYIRTTHKKLVDYMKKSPDWQEKSNSGKASIPQLKKHWNCDTTRTPYSFEYVKNSIDKERAIKQTSLFDYI